MITSKLFEYSSRLRRWMYDKKLIRSFKAKHSVISVGNLTMGGSGKTPLIHWIVQLALKENLVPIVVCKSYKTKLKNWCVVNLLQTDMYSLYGDEAVLTAKKFPNVTVLTGPTKWQSILEFEKVTDKKFDFFLIDDGFQHLKIQRDFNIVILDSSQKLEHYQFPGLLTFKGRLRDPISFSKFADLVIVSKADQITNEFKTDVLNKVKSEKILSFFSYNQNDFLSIKNTRNFLVCGIGNPTYFINQIKSLGVTWIKQFIFEDHKNYETEFVVELLKQMQLDCVDKLICTEKDLVKLEKFDDLKPYLHPIGIELCFEQPPTKVINFIKGLTKDG